MIILRLLLLLTNLHLKLLSTQGTGADKLLSTQRVKLLETNIFHKNVVTFNTLGPIYLVKTVKFGINFPSQVMHSEVSWPKCSVG